MLLSKKGEKSELRDVFFPKTKSKSCVNFKTNIISKCIL